ncbi:response regulator transcription factor [Dactylosporangium sp. NPDC049742]|uniref:response regulator transcription factor n=1 Tax=Dactylosporangium sp. NPDC049742 TaxID=3154737 RepID=UPI0034147F44
MSEVRVVVVDDQALVRVGLCGIVATGDGLTVVGEAADGLAAVDVVTRLAPDVVLMDIRMPVLDGIEATRRITASTASRVLILTTFDLDEYVYGALRAGASGFLLKDAPPEDLHAAIRVIAAGDALLAPGVTRRLIATFAASSAASVDPVPVPLGSRPAPDALGGLTDRERQVLALVAEGLTNAEIGLRLHVTAGTAKTHVARLLHKLDARDRIQLVIIAHRAGLAP